MDSSSSVPLLNKKVVGYYRVTYDETIWRDIGSVLQNNHHRIHPNNRAQIVCDLAHLADHGYIDQDLADQVMSYYEDKEEDFVVVRAHYQCVAELESDHARK